MVLGQLQGLKDKARIKINDSCVLIGVIDEDGILEEGEVFIQVDQRPYTEPRDGKMSRRLKQLLAFTSGEETRKIISGLVLVTKNPCTHAGDIRKLRAVG